MKSAGTGTDKMASVRAASIAKRMAAKPGQPGVPLTREQVERRERCFVIYRDFGKSRTIHKLHRVLSEEHPHLLATKVTLARWSKRHNWVERAEAFDRGIAMATLPPPVLMRPDVDPEFNSVDALMMAAQKALTKAMNANPTVTRPGDVKTLVDAAANAMKLVDSLQQKQAGKGAVGEIAADIARICDLVTIARRKDVEFICRSVSRAVADMSGQPVEQIYQVAAAAAGVRVEVAKQATTLPAEMVDAVLAADPELIEQDEQASAAAIRGAELLSTLPAPGDMTPNRVDTPSTQPAALASFSDVLAQFRGRE